MSRFSDRQRARATELATKNAPLTEIITALGIAVPNQRQARRMMEAIRLGLPPHSSRLRIFFSVDRKMQAAEAQTHWNRIPYDNFLAGDFDGVLVESAYVPVTVKNEVALIRSVLPSADIVVRALKHDPWYTVAYRGELLIVRGWDGDTILL